MSSIDIKTLITAPGEPTAFIIRIIGTSFNAGPPMKISIGNSLDLANYSECSFYNGSINQNTIFQKDIISYVYGLNATNLAAKSLDFQFIQIDNAFIKFDCKYNQVTLATAFVYYLDLIFKPTADASLVKINRCTGVNGSSKVETNLCSIDINKNLGKVCEFLGDTSVFTQYIANAGSDNTAIVTDISALKAKVNSLGSTVNTMLGSLKGFITGVNSATQKLNSKK